VNADNSVTVHAIVRAVARSRGIPERHILSHRRDKPTADARLVAYWLAREVPGLSSTVIGRVIGFRDHSSVLTGAKVIAERMGSDPALAAELSALRSELVVGARMRLSPTIAEPDPIGAAERIMRSIDPVREGLRTSALDVAAMAARLVDLEEVAGGAFQLLDRIDRARAMRPEAAALYNAETRELIEVIASTLEALGYETTNEETDEKEVLNDASTAAAE
jgi:hypothetical protein